MVEQGEDSCENAQLRRQLALRDAEIAKNREELERATVTFRSVIALKNRKITELEKEIATLKKERDDGKKVKNETRRENRDQTEFLIAEVLELRDTVRRIEIGSGELKTLCTCLSQNVGVPTIRARFTNISKLTTHTFSRPIRVAGMDWAILICTTTDGATKYLSAYLDANSNRSIPQSWSCMVSFSIRLYSHGTEERPLATGWDTLIFTKERTGWGSTKFLPFEDLLNPANNYVKDDAIRMELSFKVYPTV